MAMAASRKAIQWTMNDEVEHAYKGHREPGSKLEYSSVAFD